MFRNRLTYSEQQFCGIFLHMQRRTDSAIYKSKILCKSKLSFMFPESWPKRFEFVKEVFFFHVTNTESKCKKTNSEYNAN